LFFRAGTIAILPSQRTDFLSERQL
jgi:hypothetical protein